MPDDESPEGIYRAAQAAALHEAVSAEAGLQQALDESAAEIRTKLRADPDNANAVRPTVKEALRKTSFKRRRLIAEVIEKASAKGPKAARKTLRQAFGADVTRAQVRTSAKALREGADRIAGRVTVDHVSLSQRIRDVDAELGNEMALQIERGIKTRKGILQIARKIEKLDNVTEGLPKYLQEVESLARRGAPELKATAKAYLKRANKLLGTLQADGTRKASAYSIRSPTQKFLRDIQKAGADDVDALVKDYIQKRGAWRANLIARNEAVDAMHESYVNNAKGKPGVYAFRWNLSSGGHHRPDVCDLLANQNACGLGPGVYTADKLPGRPHCGCLCAVVACVDSRAFERQEGGPAALEEAADHHSPNAAGWLRQNHGAAAAILGPTRHELFKQGVNVLDAGGRPMLVRDLLGVRNAAE